MQDLLRPVSMGLATKNAKVISIVLGSPQRLEYLHKMLALELIEGVLTNHHELFRKVRTSSGSYFSVMFITPVTLTFILTPLSLLPLKTPRSLTPHMTRVVFLLLKQSSSKLATEIQLFLALADQTRRLWGGDW